MLASRNKHFFRCFKMVMTAAASGLLVWIYDNEKVVNSIVVGLLFCKYFFVLVETFHYKVHEEFPLPPVWFLR